MLGLQDQAPRVVFDGERDRRFSRQRFGVIVNVPVHQVVFGVMSDEDEMLEMHDFSQPACEIMQQCLQIPVSHDRFPDRQKRVVLLTGGKRRFFCRKIVHVEDPVRIFAL